MKTLAAVTALAAAIAIVGCAVHQQEAPGLSGPSQLAFVLTVTATPDSISQDGGSQSSILIVATGPSGQPVSGVPIRLDILVNGVPQDFGTLSARNVVTNSSGAATAVYTAPPTPAGSPTPFCQANPLGAVLPGNCVSIRATPTGSQLATELSFSTTIRLVPPGIILPPVKTPKAAFTVIPNGGALVGQNVTFDASASCAETDSAGACVTNSSSRITTYSWSFGDGGTASGQLVSHTYNSASTFPVTLTVTNSTGGSASTTQAIVIGFPTAPTADFTISPTSPNVNDKVFFDASGSKAAPGHNITQFNWNFGDGTSGNGVQVSHVYTTANTFTVTLSVLDDTGQQATSSKTITVGGGPKASFTSTPGAAGSKTVTFDATASTAPAGSTIVSYNWSFGDTPAASGTGVIAIHVYTVSSPPPVIVTLTVTDSLGRTASSTASVTVP